jgi:hypothetical protein
VQSDLGLNTQSYSNFSLNLLSLLALEIVTVIILMQKLFGGAVSVIVYRDDRLATVITERGW